MRIHDAQRCIRHGDCAVKRRRQLLDEINGARDRERAKNERRYRGAVSYGRQSKREKRDRKPKGQNGDQDGGNTGRLLCVHQPALLGDIDCDP